jgi:hypothetical protein
MQTAKFTGPWGEAYYSQKPLRAFTNRYQATSGRKYRVVLFQQVPHPTHTVAIGECVVRVPAQEESWFFEVYAGLTILDALTEPKIPMLGPTTFPTRDEALRCLEENLATLP